MARLDRLSVLSFCGLSEVCLFVCFLFVCFCFVFVCLFVVCLFFYFLFLITLVKLEMNGGKTEATPWGTMTEQLAHRDSLTV